MNNEKQFHVVLLTILLQHVVSSPTPYHHSELKTKKTASPSSSNLKKLSSSSSWPPKLPSYDIWGSGEIIKKKSQNNTASLSSSVSPTLSSSASSSLLSSKISSVSHPINENDIDDEGNMVYVHKKETLRRRRNGKGN